MPNGHTRTFTITGDDGEPITWEPHDGGFCDICEKRSGLMRCKQTGDTLCKFHFDEFKRINYPDAEATEE